jgi:hypothetical protein
MSTVRCRSGRASPSALVAAALLTALPAAQSSQERSTTFRASADVVSVDVSVRRGGRPVTDLKEGDFEVMDRDVAQSITDLSYGKLPIDVTVALDLSSSVTGAVLADLRQSVSSWGAT